LIELYPVEISISNIPVGSPSSYEPTKKKRAVTSTENI